MRFVKKLQESEQGTATYGPTQFADLSKEEFQKKHLGLLKPRPDPSMKRAAIPRGTPPTAWDWREHGAVTKVKNQVGHLNSNYSQSIFLFCLCCENGNLHMGTGTFKRFCDTIQYQYLLNPLTLAAKTTRYL